MISRVVLIHASTIEKEMFDVGWQVFDLRVVVIEIHQQQPGSEHHSENRRASKKKQTSRSAQQQVGIGKSQGTVSKKSNADVKSCKSARYSVVSNFGRSKKKAHPQKPSPTTNQKIEIVSEEDRNTSQWFQENSDKPMTINRDAAHRRKINRTPKNDYSSLGRDNDNVQNSSGEIAPVLRVQPARRSESRNSLYRDGRKVATKPTRESTILKLFTSRLESSSTVFSTASAVSIETVSDTFADLIDRWISEESILEHLPDNVATSLWQSWLLVVIYAEQKCSLSMVQRRVPLNKILSEVSVYWWTSD